MNVKVVALSALCAVTVFACAACSSGAHQVIDANEQCSSCHSSEKPQYEVAEPKDAFRVQPGQELHVSSGGDPLMLCTPIYTSEDGSTFVPVLYQTLSRGDAVDITLEEGTWVLAADLGDASRSHVVIVDPALSEPGEANITL